MTTTPRFVFYYMLLLVPYFMIQLISFMSKYDQNAISSTSTRSMPIDTVNVCVILDAPRRSRRYSQRTIS